MRARYGSIDLGEIEEGAHVIVHVGKSGGTTIRDALKRSDHQAAWVLHIMDVPYRADLTYTIIARGPIARARSAFESRRSIVLDRGEQLDRFPGEVEALSRYADFERLAIALYGDDGTPNVEAQSDFRSIHHLREDMAFTIGAVLEKAAPEQINGVIMQEALVADTLRMLGLSIEQRLHQTEGASARRGLSADAVGKLQRFLQTDFDCLEQLFRWGKIAVPTYQLAIAATR